MAQRMSCFLLILLPFFSQGQTVHAEQESFRIDGENIVGYQVALSSPETDVSNALEKYLRVLGKPKNVDGVLTIAEPVIGGTKYSNPLVATTRQVGATTAVWFGLKDGSADRGSAGGNIEKIARDFGVTFYQDKIQLQVDESLRALQTVERQHARLASQNRDLTNRIESNKRKKIELENSLVENRKELEELTKRIHANSKAQDSIAVATDQIKKIVEMHQDRKKKVN